MSDDERTALLGWDAKLRAKQRRQRWCCCDCKLFTCYLVTSVLFISLMIITIAAIYGRYTSPTAGIDMKLCSDIADVEFPSLGLALSISRGSGATIHSNGEVETLESIIVEDDFVEVMERLSKYSSRHLYRPYSDVVGGPFPFETLRQWFRRLRQRLGLPASSDVGTLAKPLRPVIEAYRSKYGCQPTEGILVTTGIQAFYDEDTEDIMTYLGLRQLPLRHYPWLSSGCETPHELASVFAAHGFGLCKTYWNATACAEEESEMPFQWVFGISFNRKGIAFSQARLKSAYHEDNTLYDYVGFEGYGTDYKDTYGSDEDEYWKTIFLAIGRYTRQPPDYTTTKVFIFDEVSDEDAEKLQRIIQVWLDRIPSTIEYYKDKPLFVTAIGAARLAQSGRYVDTTLPKPRKVKSELRTMSPDGLHCPWTGVNLNDSFKT